MMPQARMPQGEPDTMNKTLRKAIESESEQKLIACLARMHKKKETFAPEDYPFVEKALSATWHSQHEDLVNTVYLDNLQDDRFVEPILNIALHRETFRGYDDELEPTLRKCVHALKSINSGKSNEALEKLIRLNNDNVTISLEMYPQNDPR